MTFSSLGPWFRNRLRRRIDPDLGFPEPAGARRRGPFRGRTGRIIAALHGTVVDLLAVLIPVDCVCCEMEDAVLCSSCARRIRQLCRHPFRAELESPALIDINGTAKIGVVAAGPYRDELARCLLSFKSHGQWRLASVLAPCLGKAVCQWPLGSAHGRSVDVPAGGQ
jgi:hypothetical protein